MNTEEMKTKTKAILNNLWKELYGEETAGIIDERSFAFLNAQKAINDALTDVQREERNIFKKRIEKLLKTKDPFWHDWKGPLYVLVGWLVSSIKEEKIDPIQSPAKEEEKV